MKRIAFIFLLFLFAVPVFAGKPKKEKNTYVRITTEQGSCVVKLYNETPLHRDNFIKLVKEGFYDSLLFHRVIFNFMIQGGDPESKNAAPEKSLGNGDVGYKIPAEFNSNLYHKKGALAAARDNNPEKASSGCQFYLVQGRVLTDQEIIKFENKNKITYTQEQRETYRTIGGTPHLDNNYTVFGEIVEGLEMVDKVAMADVDPGTNRPKTDVHMKIELIKKYKAPKKKEVS